MQRARLPVGASSPPLRHPRSLPLRPAEDAAAFDSRALRNLLGLFATGVTVVTAETADGRRAGLTANSFASVSLAPPLVSVCIATTSAGGRIVRERGAFAVHVLGADQEEDARRFARPGPDKPGLAALGRSALGNPVLERYMALLECELHAAYPGGDHRIFVGRVLRMHANPRAGSALTFFRGRFAPFAGA